MSLRIGDGDGFDERFGGGCFGFGPVFDRLTQGAGTAPGRAGLDEGGGLEIVEDASEPLSQGGGGDEVAADGEQFAQSGGFVQDFGEADAKDGHAGVFGDGPALAGDERGGQQQSQDFLGGGVRGLRIQQIAAPVQVAFEFAEE